MTVGCCRGIHLAAFSEWRRRRRRRSSGRWRCGESSADEDSPVSPSQNHPSEHTHKGEERDTASLLLPLPSLPPSYLCLDVCLFACAFLFIDLFDSVWFVDASIRSGVHLSFVRLFIPSLVILCVRSSLCLSRFRLRSLICFEHSFLRLFAC